MLWRRHAFVLSVVAASLLGVVTGPLASASAADEAPAGHEEELPASLRVDGAARGQLPSASEPLAPEQPQEAIWLRLIIGPDRDAEGALEGAALSRDDLRSMWPWLHDTGRGPVEADDAGIQPGGRESTAADSPDDEPAGDGALDETNRPGDMAVDPAAADDVADNDDQGPTWVWPAGGEVTSEFGRRWGRRHEGIDVANAVGTPVVAAADGDVSFAQAESGYGLTVKIEHGDGLETAYSHLSAITVTAGQTVAAGDRLGAMGCTGSCTGPHVHFEVRRSGAPADPRTVLP